MKPSLRTLAVALLAAGSLSLLAGCGTVGNIDLDFSIIKNVQLGTTRSAVTDEGESSLDVAGGGTTDLAADLSAIPGT